eukprot:TRINITY_DN8051_c0_g2_i1.p1 TRINITY_DN8051_c0_g2~~TRINITY_DN8051_c0_g2_i1.p1  ORF type:complete len:1181 (-),score=263.83 TRINITY_DN8051_c0_g2_i1:81-3560(-)
MEQALAQFDRGRLQQRLDRLLSAWTSQADALLILTGEDTGSARKGKAAAMHQWFFGMEFPELLIVVHKSGKVVYFASEKKIDHLRKVEAPSTVLLRRTRGIKGLDPAQVPQLSEVIKDFKASATIGFLKDEALVGPFATDVLAAVRNTPGVQLVACEQALSVVLARKDEAEIALMKKAAVFAEDLMQNKFLRGVEIVVDGDLRRTNAALCSDVEKSVETPEYAQRCSDKLELEPEETNVVFCCLQSGKSFDLRLGAPPPEGIIPMQGSYLLSLGVQYAEYAACLTRTMLVDPVADLKQAYSLVLEVQELVIGSLKHGAKFKNIFGDALRLVEQKKPDLVPQFAPNVGWVMGLEMCDAQMLIDADSEWEVLPGMGFCVSVGISESRQGRPGAPWAAWLCDSVIVPLVAGEGCQVLTAGSKKVMSDIMFELMDDAEPAPTSTPAPAPAPAPAAVSAAPRAPETAKPATSSGAVRGAAVARTNVAPKAKGKAKAKAKEQTAAKAGSKIDKRDEPRTNPRQEAEKAKENKRAMADLERVQAKKATQAAAKRPEPPKQRSAKVAAPGAVNARSASSHSGGITERGRSSRGRNAQAKMDMQAEVKIEEQQVAMRAKKFEEIKQRFASGGFGQGAGQIGLPKLHEYHAYSSLDRLPKELKPNLVQLDIGREVLLVPVAGSMVPFHTKMIKNMSRNSTEQREFLRVNFFTPGAGKSQDDYPMINGSRVYVKELSFVSVVSDNFDAIVRGFKEVQKKSRQRELEGEVRQVNRGDSDPPALQVTKAFPCLRDLNMRPTMGAGSRRTIGTLEAHENGFRFSVKGNTEKLVVMYSQVKHAIYEPCEGYSLIVLLHLRLKEPMMVGKKKTHDLQFFTEVQAQTEDLTQIKVGSAHDPDEIMEEQRDRELKERLNKVFKDFATKVEDLNGCPFSWDVPFTKQLTFSGVPGKSSIRLCPCVNVLVGFEEWPPFVLTLDDIDIVVFERLTNTSLREFDMVFVKKNYEELPIRITTIPRNFLSMIRSWLVSINVVFYSLGVNMQWPMIMKEITSNPQEFLNNGGWEPWVGGGSDSDDSDQEDADDAESDWEADDSDVADADVADEASDFSGGTESSSAAPSNSDEEGMDWDELEKEAENADKRQTVEARQSGREGGGGGASTRRSGRAPPPKRARK